jgi:hypothetical protein
MEGIKVNSARFGDIMDSSGNRVSHEEFEQYGRPAIRLVPQLQCFMTSPEIVKFVKELLKLK